LLGVTSFSEMTPQYIAPAAPVSDTHVFSAFPHLP
jgi:hypothetical protein